MLRIHNVKVRLGKINHQKVLSQHLNIREKEIKSIRLVKQSIDSRRKTIYYVNSYDFEVDNEEDFLKKHKNVQKVKPYHYTYLPGNDNHVIIVGTGPAGLFCGYVLAKSGNKVTMIERGKKVEDRMKDVDDLMNHHILHVESNIAFGEGGAGTFSDGKLTTNVKNERITYILETFVKYGAPREILYQAKAHIGTDYLRQVVVNMRQAMEKMGVTFLFETQFVDMFKSDEGIEVKIRKHDQLDIMHCDDLVLAIGHSARDTYAMLSKHLSIQPKPFSVGVRIEQLQSSINDIQYHGVKSKYLPPASYKLAVKTMNGRGVYTFCMCPGGQVVPSMNEDNMICINGMSYHSRDLSNANSAILVSITPDDFKSDDVLAGITFQRELEKKAFELGGGNYQAPVQLAFNYIYGENYPIKDVIPSYKPGVKEADLNQLFPQYINESLKDGLIKMNEKMPGFIDESTILTGVETRSSSPVRIIRDEHYQSSMKGVHPIGEGAGYAGGIMSSAVDGMICAEKILLGEE
ncbi:MAG: NAD(P)/FAD-dependent oxidoreductase [Erysipelotrichaceae bacterium]|nr:NAD(P)/FAD-dependent oxidoreductase [Erysipelotrichaceae bacterium]